VQLMRALSSMPAVSMKSVGTTSSLRLKAWDGSDYYVMRKEFA